MPSAPAPATPHAPGRPRAEAPPVGKLLPLRGPARDARVGLVRAPVWTIILAGGEGRRMRDFIKTNTGSYRPKQYCRFGDGPTLIERTAERAARLGADAQTLAVVGRSHDRWLAELAWRPRPERVLEQPMDRGSGAALLLALAMILAEAPDAVTLVTPADLVAEPEAAYLVYLMRAVSLAAADPAGAILLAAPPAPGATLGGWLVPGETENLAAVPIRRMGSAANARRAGTAASVVPAGALADTLAFAARASALWALAWRVLPDVMPAFESLRAYYADRAGIPVVRSFIPPAVRHVYERLPHLDARADLLARDRLGARALAMTGVTCADLDNPARLP